MGEVLYRYLIHLISFQDSGAHGNILNPYYVITISSLMVLIIVLHLFMHIIGVLHIARDKFAWQTRILFHCPVAEAAALQPPNDDHLNAL